MRRFVATLALAVLTIGLSYWTAFRWPDETWPRRWLDHPEAMIWQTLAAVAMLAVAFRPGKDRS